MTIDTMNAGSYLALLLLAALGAVVAHCTLQPLALTQGALKRSDLIVVAFYLAGVSCLVYEKDLRPEDMVLRVGIHALLLGYGWWRCLWLTRINSTFRRF